jgi:hypothetical protein
MTKEIVRGYLRTGGVAVLGEIARQLACPVPVGQALHAPLPPLSAKHGNDNIWMEKKSFRLKRCGKKSEQLHRYR